MKRFAVLQLSGCAGCEVSLLNADAWVEQMQLVYMPLVTSVYDVPDVDVLLISGGVRTDEDLYKLRRAVKKAQQVVAVGTCAISGGVANLGDRDEVRALFLSETHRPHVPRLLPKSHPVDAFVEVDLYLPGCPPTPELFMAVLTDPAEFQASKIVCQECGRHKLRDMKPDAPVGLPARRSAARHLPDQPGLPLRRLIDAGWVPCAVYARWTSVRGLSRTVGCFYREGIRRVAEEHQACLCLAYRCA